MCELATALTLATFALGATQAVTAYGAQADAHAQGEALAQRETERYDANVKSSQAANRQDHVALHSRELQERDALQEKNRIAAVEGARARGKQAAATGESNVSGISVDNILADLERGPANDQTQREATYMNVVSQLREEMKGADARSEARINSLKVGYNPVAPASGASLALGIAGAGLSAGGTYMKLTADKAKAEAPKKALN